MKGIYRRLCQQFCGLLVIGSTMTLTLAQAADGLSRGTLLGIIPEQVGQNQHVVLQQILPNSTASQLGLQQGDIVHSINGEATPDFSSLLAAIRNLTTGAAIQVSITRDEASRTLSGHMQPRPFETSETAEVIYDSVKYAGNHLRSIVYKPSSLQSGQRAPAIFFIQGYTCSSIDYGMAPNVTTRQMVERFAEAGYVVYRIEKPGLGDSQSEVNCDQINFSQEAQAFVHGLKALKQKDYVDASQVYIWGHSLGVLHAPVVAEQEAVAGIIGYGGVYKPWYDYMLDIYAIQSVKHFDTPQAQAQRNTKLVQPFWHLLLNTDTPWEEMLADDDVQAAISSELIGVSGDQVINRHFSFFRDLNRYDFSQLWKTSKVPVLMMHGSLDIQAISQEWAFDVVAQNANPKSQATVIEGAEHAFMRYKDRAAHMQARNSGRYNPAEPESHYDPRVAQTTLDWLAKIRGK